jgi:UTP:GlnB (protein PII) uridylyltransferase
MTACKLDIRHAKVLTLGNEIVDSFYVVDVNGNKLDRRSSEEVRLSVQAELLALGR